MTAALHRERPAPQDTEQCLGTSVILTTGGLLASRGGGQGHPTENPPAQCLQCQEVWGEDPVMLVWETVESDPCLHVTEEMVAVLVRRCGAGGPPSLGYVEEGGSTSRVTMDLRCKGTSTPAAFLCLAPRNL